MSLGFTLDPFGTVKEIIVAWQPKRSRTEKGYKESLVTELGAKLKKQKIDPEYGSGRQKVDIVVADKVPIEIKKDLKSNSVYHSVRGQLGDYLEKWERVILVLCGDIDHNLLKSLKKYAKDKENALNWIMGERIIIIVKN
jgi:hypothetical protein